MKSNSEKRRKTNLSPSATRGTQIPYSPSPASFTQGTMNNDPGHASRIGDNGFYEWNDPFHEKNRAPETDEEWNNQRHRLLARKYAQKRLSHEEATKLERLNERLRILYERVSDADRAGLRHGQELAEDAQRFLSKLSENYGDRERGKDG